MKMLRFIAVAFAASSAVPLCASAFTAPLDNGACLKLQDERKKLLTAKMRAALEQGPDWVKNHLNDDDIEKVREFLLIEETIEFRCRDSVVAKAMQEALANPDGVPLPDRKPTPPGGVAAGNSAAPGNTSSAGTGGTVDPEMPLPDRNPAAAEGTIADVKPSQTVADSDKTAPSTPKATR
jgi:hypothetical protein